MRTTESQSSHVSTTRNGAVSNARIIITPVSRIFQTKGSPTGSQKKVKRTLPNPPPEEVGAGTGQGTFSGVGSVSRRRVCRTNTMARAKILQDIDRELELVERESSKLRKKQAELDEEEKEIDAKLRYLELGINRRKEALLKEREKRERAYLQGVAEDRDYMSDSEVSNIRETRLDGQHGLERPRTAPQPDYNQFLSPQTQAQPQYGSPSGLYTPYPYATPTPLTQAPTAYQPQALYHQHVSPYPSVPTIAYSQPTPANQHQHPAQLLLVQQKMRHSTLVDLEPKITSNYETVCSQPLLMSSPGVVESSYSGSPHLGLRLGLGLDDGVSLPMGSSVTGVSDSFYAELGERHAASRSYVLIEDLGELGHSGGVSGGFSLHEAHKEMQKSERLLRAGGEARRAAEAAAKDFVSSLPGSARLHGYGKVEEDPMEEPYELKLLKQQIKQEFRRGNDGLEHLSGLPHYHPHHHGTDSTNYRHFPKSEKYSIGRLTLEKQAAKQLPLSFLYQKQSQHKKPLLEPKVSKFSPIQEARDGESDYGAYLGSSAPSLVGVSSRARLIQDSVTFGLRKNIQEQQKFLGVRSALDDEVDKVYASSCGGGGGSRSRPSSVYGLDLSLKRDLSSSSLRAKAQDTEMLEAPSYAHLTPSGRTKPSSLPISQSRGRIPFVAQNSEEESPLSPVGQPMGMARASAGPLPPISADTREQFGSSHSLPEVQQHMREESRSRGYDRDIAFIMDDFQHAMSDSEGK
uniref:Uncharacterized protein n=1 Tax=Callorhinchus milii TaxID=7868 RepID=A0A4W3GLD4_CALMI